MTKTLRTAVAALLLTVLTAAADDRQRGREPSGDRDRDRDRTPPAAGSGQPAGDAPRDREPQRPPESQRPPQPAPEGNRAPQGGADRCPPTQNPSGGYYPPGGGYYPPNGGPTTRRLLAEAVIEHPRPSFVRARLGAVGDPFWAASVSFREDGYDIVRSEGDRYRPPNDGRRLARVSIDLSRWAQYADGYREWYLRLEDPFGDGGYLRSFSIQSDYGVAQVRSVPAWFGQGRNIEARVTPRGGSYGGGYPGGYPGGYEPYPNPGGQPYPGPGSSNALVVRRINQQVRPDGRLVIEYLLNPSASRIGRLEVTENLPPTGWRILNANPRPRYQDNRGLQVVWDLINPSPGQRLLLEVLAPRTEGWQTFWGTTRLDGSGSATIGGENRVLVSTGYYQQPGYYDWRITPAPGGPGELLKDILPQTLDR